MGAAVAETCAGYRFGGVSVEGDRILLLAVRWRSVGEEGSVVWAWKGVVSGPR